MTRDDRRPDPEAPPPPARRGRPKLFPGAAAWTGVRERETLPDRVLDAADIDAQMPDRRRPDARAGTLAGGERGARFSIHFPETLLRRMETSE